MASTSNKNGTTVHNQGSESLETTMTDFWLGLLDEALEEVPELHKEREALQDEVTAYLKPILEGVSLPRGSQNPLDLTSDELEEQVAMEKTKMRRLERRLERHQDLLEEEESRLKSFTRSRQAQEKLEEADYTQRMHQYAKAILSDNLPRRRKQPAAVVVGMKHEQRRVEAESDDSAVYDPMTDLFLLGLADRLKPTLEKLK